MRVWPLILFVILRLEEVLIQGSSFLGGAHPSNIFHRLLVAPHSRSSLEIGALFRAHSPWLKAVADYCREQLSADKNLLSDPDWIRPGAAPEILVPYSVMKSFIDPQGPLKGQ